MSIGIKGIRIDDFSVTFSDGVPKVEAHYSLISTADKVLAKQGVNGYSDVKVEPSSEAKKALDAFLVAFKADVSATLGLE